MTLEREKIIKECKKKLRALKERYERTLKNPSSVPEEKSEIVDRSTRELQLQSSQFFRQRIQATLPEIDYALARIKDGTYGYCAVTGAEIEERRLLAVPWTRTSIKVCNLEAS